MPSKIITKSAAKKSKTKKSSKENDYYTKVHDAMYIVAHTPISKSPYIVIWHKKKDLTVKDIFKVVDLLNLQFNVNNFSITNYIRTTVTESELMKLDARPDVGVILE